MKPITKQLDLLIFNFWGNITLLSLGDVLSYDRLSHLLDKRNQFKLTKRELQKLNKFPFEFIKEQSLISFRVKQEIDLTIERRIEKRFHLNNYLQSIYDKVGNILNIIYTLNFIERLKNDTVFMQCRIYTTGLTATQIQHSILVADFMRAHLAYFNDFKDVQMHVLQKQEHFGFLTSLKDNTNPIQQPDHPKGGLDIKTQLINPDKGILQNEGNWLARQRGTVKLLIDDYTLFPKLYKLCVDEKMFESPVISVNDFNACFDLSEKPSIYPKFKRGSQIKFVYILSRFDKINEEIEMNEEIAKTQFGIKGYKTQKSRLLKENPPKHHFKNAVCKILNLNQSIEIR